MNLPRNSTATVIECCQHVTGVRLCVAIASTVDNKQFGLDDLSGYSGLHACIRNIEISRLVIAVVIHT